MMKQNNNAEKVLLFLISETLRNLESIVVLERLEAIVFGNERDHEISKLSEADWFRLEANFQTAKLVQKSCNSNGVKWEDFDETFKRLCRYCSILQTMEDNIDLYC